ARREPKIRLAAIRRPCRVEMGCFGLFSGGLIAVRFGFSAVKPLLGGGLAYSLGGLLEYDKWPILIPGVIHSHEIFHVLVLIGALWQWLFVWRIAAGRPQTQAEAIKIE